ncbi:MAG: hypothetical protein ACE5RC_00085 [Nitrosopumilus sp.]
MARPKTNINWLEVDMYLEAGCTGTEIAGFLGIHPDTLYIHCQENHKMGFSSYSQQKKSRGDALLRKRQFDIAMEGDKTILIWLGKCRLGQQELDSLKEREKEDKRHQFVNNIDEYVENHARDTQPEAS